MALQFSSLPPVRVVFEVTMEGSARKVITVRSALIVKNKLETPMELRLDSPSAPDSKSQNAIATLPRYISVRKTLSGRTIYDGPSFWLLQNFSCPILQ